MSMRAKPKEDSTVNPRSQPYVKLKTNETAFQRAWRSNGAPSYSPHITVLKPAVQPEGVVINMPSDEERAKALGDYNSRIVDETKLYYAWLQAYAGLSDGVAPKRTETSVISISGTDKKKTRRKVVNEVHVCMLVKGETWGKHSKTSQMYEARHLESLAKRAARGLPLETPANGPVKGDKWDGTCWSTHRNPIEGFEQYGRPPTFVQLLAATWRAAPMSASDAEGDEHLESVVDALISVKVAEKISDNLEMYGTPLCKLELDLETGVEKNQGYINGEFRTLTTEGYLEKLHYRSVGESLLAPVDIEDELPIEAANSEPYKQQEVLLLPSPKHFEQQDELIRDLKEMGPPTRSMVETAQRVDHELHELVKLSVSAKLYSKPHAERFRLRQWYIDRSMTQSLCLFASRMLDDKINNGIRSRNRKVMKLLDSWATDDHKEPGHGVSYGLVAGRRGTVVHKDREPTRSWVLRQDQLTHWAGGPVYRMFPRSTIRDDELRWKHWWQAVMLTTGQGAEYKQLEKEFEEAGKVAQCLPTTDTPLTYTPEESGYEPSLEEVSAWYQDLSTQPPVLDTEKLPDLSDEYEQPVLRPIVVNMFETEQYRKEPVFSPLTEADLMLYQKLQMTQWRESKGGLLIPASLQNPTPLMKLKNWLDTPLFG